jgi:hypothetical protein
MEDFFLCPVSSSLAYAVAVHHIVPQVNIIHMGIVVSSDQRLHSFPTFVEVTLQRRNVCKQENTFSSCLSFQHTALRFPCTLDSMYPLFSHICLGLKLCCISFLLR